MMRENEVIVVIEEEKTCWLMNLWVDVSKEE